MGDKQTHSYDADVAELVADDVHLPFRRADFVGEGGAIETDGDGTVMATESSLVNKNRNRGMSKAEIEDAVLHAYGADKMLWVPGIKGKDITDDHIDVTSRFVRPGVVMVQVPPADRNDVWARDAREQFSILSRATDARGRRLKVIRVEGPDTVRSKDSQFVDSYLNFHVVNGAVVTAQFGDAAKDAAAVRALAEAFPGGRSYRSTSTGSWRAAAASTAPRCTNPFRSTSEHRTPSTEYRVPSTEFRVPSSENSPPYPLPDEAVCD